MNNELYHWKYIKREKKGGKWVYTYDTEGAKRDVKNFVNDPIGTKAKKAYRQSQERTRNAQNTVVGRLISDIDYREASYGHDPNNAGRADRVARENAVNDYRRDQVHLAVAKGKEKVAKEAYDKTALGKLDKSISNTKHLINEGKYIVKDKLGFDERDALNKAQKEVNETSYRKSNALINAKEAYDYAERTGDDYYYETRADEYRNKKESYDKAVSKRDKAKQVYYDTPIGKLAEAGERISAAKDYIDDLFTRKKTATFESTTKELQELEDFERMLNKRKK